MKIAVDLRGLLSGQLTGVGEYAFNLLKAMLEIDPVNHYLIFSSSLKKAALPAEFSNNPRVEHCHFYCPSKLFNFSLKFFNRPRLNRLTGPVEVWWFPNLNFWSLDFGCPVVMTVHDLSFAKLPWAYSAKRQLWHQAINPAKKLRQASAIAAVSQHTKNDLVQTYGLAPVMIEVVYPALPEFNSIDAADVEQDLVLPDKYVLFLGTLEPRKNIESIIRAFAELALPGYSLIIAGGHGWLYQKIYHLAAELKLNNKVKFLGYVTATQKRTLLKKAGLLIWPSFYEGFGLPPMEAMAAGVPVISSANSSLPEVAGDAALLVDPYNIQELKQAISGVLTDDGLRQSLINKGYEQIKKFNWHDSAKKMLKIFESISK
ncbi:MAG: glycosyltransferase family 1 protein [Candidatus Komeilibacteria bacterium]|nr:glycosyltransferase family 1 protein [Candidatus Komeilibacteria bacterium]